MTAPRTIAVIDVGKTNAKLVLVDGGTLREIAVIKTDNRALPGPPWPHFDLDGLWAFFVDGLTHFQREHGVDAISVTTHGASITLIDHAGRALPMLDYEYDGPDALSDRYDTIRPDFSETGSPRLPMGLNVGAQLHWMLETDPSLRDRIATIVTYPQYWGFRLTGNAACDPTSLGCHTDLWSPKRKAFSTLPATLGLLDKFAPVRRPDETIGTIRPEIAQATGLRPDTPVAVGIHDSNASLYPHVLRRSDPFSVVSTGTWVIAMAMNGDPPKLDPGRDTLINVNALGNEVPTARFMGGREFERIMGGMHTEPTEADRKAVRRKGVLLLPSVEQGTGPFPRHQHRWTVEPETQAERQVALSHYLALMTATCLDLIGAKGPIVVEGPFSKNTDYLAMLATARGSTIDRATGTTGTSTGAAMLCLPTGPIGTHGAWLVEADPSLNDLASNWSGLVRMAG